MVQNPKLSSFPTDFIPSIEHTSSLNISDTLSSFRFSSDPDSIPDFATLVGLRDSWAEEDVRLPLQDGDEYDGTPIPAPTGEVQDFFGDEDFDMVPPMGMSGFDDGASMAGDDEAGDPFGGGPLGMAGPGEQLGPFDPRRGPGELVMALAGGDDEGMFDYFDRGLGKAWAGAEHWKLRKVSRKGEFHTSNRSHISTNTSRHRRRSRRNQDNQSRQDPIYHRLHLPLHCFHIG
jgi:condensin complex subunit 2